MGEEESRNPWSFKLFYETDTMSLLPLTPKVFLTWRKRVQESPVVYISSFISQSPQSLDIGLNTSLKPLTPQVLAHQNIPGTLV